VEQTTIHRRGGWSTRLECATNMTADAHHFRLQATLKAYEGDQLFAVREWDETIPRRLL